MTRRPLAASTAAALAPLAPPLAAFAAAAVFAARHASSAAAAETAYLALLAGALLLCLAALAGRGAGGRRLVPLAATLAVLTLWVVPAGPTRGAALMAMLVGSLALAFAGRVTGTVPLSGPRPIGDAGRWRFTEAFAVLLPVAVALQVLARSDRLLAIELTPPLAAGLLGLPVLAAAAVACLAHRHGRDGALLAGAAAVLVSGAGVGAVTAGGLAVTALAILGRDLGSRRSQATGDGSGPGLWGRALVWGGLAAIVAAMALRDPAAAAVAAGVAAVLGLSAPVGVVVGAHALLAVFVAPGDGWGAAGERVALAAVVLPAAVWTVLPPRRGREILTASVPAIALVAAAARWGGGTASMAAPLALVVLLAARPVEPAAAADPVLAPQRVWSGALLALSALLAAFPWLRETPVDDALALFGLGADIRAAAFVVAGTLVLGLGARWARGGRGLAAPRPLWARPAAWAAGALALAAGLALPPGPPRPLLAEAEVILDAARPELAVSLGGPPDGASGDAVDGLPGGGPVPGKRPIRSMVGSLVIDSNLSHAATLRDRQPVATVRLLDGGGSVDEWKLLAGRDTAEWAARRPDVADGLAHAIPAPWLASVAPEGGFFGQVYRGRWRSERPLAASRLEIRLAPGLPPETVLHLYRVEAEP